MKKRFIYQLATSILLATLCSLAGTPLYAQKAKERRLGILAPDSIRKEMKLEGDSLQQLITLEDSTLLEDQLEWEELEAPINAAELVAKSDSINGKQKAKKERITFVPDSRKSVWYGLIFPGAGQIYNRKYWKLPIIYGGFMGCVYALDWNGKMYSDYSQAYLDIMDDDPNSKSYLDFLPPGYDITGQEERFKTIFKNRKDLYRRQRDLSIIAFIGVYLLSVIDAYVDAELSDFDISKDLGLKIEPALFNDSRNRSMNAVGLQCSLKF
ncbi:MAG: DUF5683 domain-containing protein [Phocaeicola sp.]